MKDFSLTNLNQVDVSSLAGSGVCGEVMVHNKFGLHARPAAQLVKLAQQYTSKISLKTANGEADAKSILDILSLAAGPGVNIQVQVSGPDERQALEAVIGFFEQ
ncbi:MAG: HPr family phosphocarrier protein [Desulfovibrionaceae bacterium]|nr:HPr family phosphocarrier protein [Desulfovibrionaceae bacterium]